jgi:dUTP pyrophosphatase
MNPTGRQLIELNVIGNIEEDSVQQHSVDLNVIEITEIIGEGFIPAKGKTQLATQRRVHPQLSSEDRLVWHLEPGAYDLTFKQCCKVPPNLRLDIKPRSSLVRNGAFVVSGWFDAGFKTDNMGCVLHVSKRLKIEMGARIATAYVDVSDEVENLYDGQFQEDKQRTNN